MSITICRANITNIGTENPKIHYYQITAPPQVSRHLGSVRLGKKRRSQRKQLFIRWREPVILGTSPKTPRKSNKYLNSGPSLLKPSFATLRSQ